jgi:hypothetical protein
VISWQLDTVDFGFAFQRIGEEQGAFFAEVEFFFGVDD